MTDWLEENGQILVHRANVPSRLHCVCLRRGGLEVAEGVRNPLWNALMGFAHRNEGPPWYAIHSGILEAQGPTCGKDGRFIVTFDTEPTEPARRDMKLQ